MTTENGAQASVAFTKRGSAYRASAPLSDLALLSNDPAQTMRKATETYEAALTEIRQWQQDVKALRSSRIPLSASKAWELGDIVYRLNADLASHGCRLENLYDHLERHAKLPPKWLTQYVTLRRYIHDVESIPVEIKWNSIMKSVRSASLAMSSDSLVDS